MEKNSYDLKEYFKFTKFETFDKIQKIGEGKNENMGEREEKTKCLIFVVIAKPFIMLSLVVISIIKCDGQTDEGTDGQILLG